MKSEKPSELLPQRVLEFIHKRQLLVGQSKLLVAVSGGPDSVCLLHILAGLSTELGIELHIAHLNHQLRGVEADADAHYVAGLADKLGIPAVIERRDVRAYHARSRTSPEEAARDVRYGFLAEVAHSLGIDQVAVGHTIDDQVETILMHLVRGTGIRGLRGLQPESHWQSREFSMTVIRPLLEVSREETLQYCAICRLLPRTDSSNLSLSPLRNRIRHQLIPLLQSYNPQVTQALLRTAAIAAEDLDFLDQETGRYWHQVACETDDMVVLDKAGLCCLSVSMQRHLLRLAIEKLVGNIKDIEAQHIEQVVTALDKPAGKKIVLPGGLLFTIEYDRYLLGREPEALSPFPLLDAVYHLNVPGITQLPGWQVQAIIIDRDRMTVGDDDFTACFDRDKVGDQLVVRSRKRGDRFQPLGMAQPKRLAEFMIDSRIPANWRDRVPLVCSPQQILWLVGQRIDDRVKVTEATVQVLLLKFERC